MNDHDFERVLNQVLDGEATPGDQSKLERHLATSPDARKRYEEVKDLLEKLERVELVEAPAELRDEIRAAVAREPDLTGRGRRRAAHAADGVPRVGAAVPERGDRAGAEAAGHLTGVAGWFDSLRSIFRSRPGPAYAFTFASGAVAGVLVLIAFMGGPEVNRLRELPVTGSMATGQPSGERVDGAKLALGDAHVSVETHLVGGGIQTVVSATSQDPVEITLSFDKDLMHLADFRWSRPEEGLIRHEPGRLLLTQQGDVRYLLLFEESGAGDRPIRVTVRSNEGSLEEVVETQAGGRGQ